jgi:hypothetical protein
MPDEDQTGRQWIVEPPPVAGEVALYLATGEGMDLTAEQEAALGALLRSLETSDPEVTGHETSTCTNYDVCRPLQCGKVSCVTLTCTLVSKARLGQSPGWTLMGSFSPRP